MIPVILPIFLLVNPSLRPQTLTDILTRKPEHKRMQDFSVFFFCMFFSSFTGLYRKHRAVLQRAVLHIKQKYNSLNEKIKDT